MNHEIISLEQIDDKSVGGKAYGLARLLGMGLRVPRAFVLRRSQLGRYPDDLDQHRLALYSDKVAVRSSALGEDGADASFAGQYESVLNVGSGADLRKAIDHCTASATTDRAKLYQREQTGLDVAAMNVVVQSMVDAKFAGVVFTADPVSARRDLLVIDAVAGLGDVLVSGEATPDHYAVNGAGEIVRRELVDGVSLLSDEQIGLITEQARAAVAHEGHPLDLEWAIDQEDNLFWLQARPITTLPSDLNELDSVLPHGDDVLTISNISEMMPGAVCPLTTTFTGWGIDYGLQHMQVTVGVRADIDDQWQITASAYGHLFLNMTGNLAMSAGVLGSSAEQTAQTLCGRIVPELKDPPPLALWRRVVNSVRLLSYCLKAPSVVERFGEDLAQFGIDKMPRSVDTWNEIRRKSWFFNHAMAVHIQSSALSGFLCAILENMVSGKSNDSTVTEQAEAVRLLAGASGVESAQMLEQLDELLDEVALHPEVGQRFQRVTAAEAERWINEAPGLRVKFQDFLRRHGHRGYRELCMRDPSWIDNVSPLIQSMQAAVQARLLTGEQKALQRQDIQLSKLSRGLRWVLPKAHSAIRRRELTKSQLVELAHQFKQAFAHLGAQMEAEGLLPDADLVYFFGTDELSTFFNDSSDAEVLRALNRRAALDFQQRLDFAEISVGMPQPLEPQDIGVSNGTLQGRPASCGVVEGVVRVANTLDEAVALQPGEILVTPITDIGWTPYFSLIGGLITDLGSSVSHGAVIAREYGLPCVVNSRQGTRVLKTGDRVRLDGDSGCITLIRD